MAVDKLVDSSQLNSDLTSVANAIRTKGGTSASLAFPSGFVSAIQAIPTGGGGGSLTQDQDGYLVVPTTGGSTPSGLEYEEGTYTPSTDETNPEIFFTNTHTQLPAFVLIADSTGERNIGSPQYGGTMIANFESFTGYPLIASSSNYVVAYTRYVASNNGAYTGASQAVGNSTISDYMTTTSFKPSVSSTTRFWKAGVPYKWIAVWAPTT